MTLRYWAPSRYVYALALAALVEYARESASEFSFGPLDLDAITSQGLVVTGEDLGGVSDVLRRVEGLIPAG